ncbi:hypothetical protein TNCV_1717521 [Trichonephila clavipes]|nr:hypothetical protein TNCV_1717521 [Trichonephila clavipes]
MVELVKGISKLPDRRLEADRPRHSIQFINDHQLYGPIYINIPDMGWRLASHEPYAQKLHRRHRRRNSDEAVLPTVRVTLCRKFFRPPLF